MKRTLITIQLAAVSLALAGCSDSATTDDSDGTGGTAPGGAAAGSPSLGTPGAVPGGGNAGTPSPGGEPSTPPVENAGGSGGGSEPGTAGMGSQAGAGGMRGGMGGMRGGMGGGGPLGGGPNIDDLDPFSFFVTSYAAMARLSGSADGFGGDLRYGEADGLSGADKICTEIAESSMPGSGAKQWRAFLSTSTVNAIERIGDGPWHDRLGRVVAETSGALQNPRPEGADPAILNDLPNEDGVPNKDPDGTGDVDNHHIMTGSDGDGMLWAEDSAEATCNDWTSSEDEGAPRVGLSWPGNERRQHWSSQMAEAGCSAGVNFAFAGGMNGEPTVGSGGGYGGIYCFALNP